jgi:hypothetical protein
MTYLLLGLLLGGALVVAWPYILGVCQMIDAAIRQH